MSKMKQWRGVWFPEGEEHLIQWMQQVNKVVDGKPTYQHHKYEAAKRHVKNWHRVIDVGGNIGLWAMHMTKDFEHTECFEPVTAYGDVLRKNAPHANLYRCALGETAQTVTMVRHSENSCGDTRPWVQGDPLDKVVQMDVIQHTLDSYNFENVGLIKVDCEGYELPVLRGGLQTILNSKPVIIVEQKPGHGSAFGYSDTAAIDYLRGIGMSVAAEVSGDFVMVW